MPRPNCHWHSGYVYAADGGCWRWMLLMVDADGCCCRSLLLEAMAAWAGWWWRRMVVSPSAASGGGLCWRRLLVVVAAATAAIVVLPFDLMHFTILNLSLMFVEYFLCLLITYNIPPCSFTLFLFYKLDIHAHLFTHLLFLLHTWLTLFYLLIPPGSTLLFLFTYCMFALLCLVLVPTCFWFHKPQPDISGISNTGSSFTWRLLLCSVQMLGSGICICCRVL